MLLLFKFSGVGGFVFWGWCFKNSNINMLILFLLGLCLMICCYVDVDLGCFFWFIINGL